MSTKMRLMILAVTTTLVLMAGCATLDGAGEDIESAGEEIQENVDS
jgi:predicted small secreted protein